jgi:hypothetical protein
MKAVEVDVKQARLIFLCGVVCALIESSSAQSPEKLASINKRVTGKWVSSDGHSYIQFFPDQSCEVGSLRPDGKWHVDKNTLSAWEKGTSFRCGDGALDLTGVNTMTRDYGMGGKPEVFHRTPSQVKHGDG